MNEPLSTDPKACSICGESPAEPCRWGGLGNFDCMQPLCAKHSEVCRVACRELRLHTPPWTTGSKFGPLMQGFCLHSAKWGGVWMIDKGDIK